MAGMVDILTTLKEEKFSQPRPIEGRTSVRGVWSARTGGLYVLHFADGSFYVGRSIHVVRRIAEHRRRKSDITHISFSLTARAQQDERETEVITRLLAAGFVLRNIDKTLPFEAQSPTTFDDKMTLELQRRWLDDVTFVDRDGPREEPPSKRALYTPRFQQLLQIPEVDTAIMVTRKYVQQCVPAQVRTERYYWQISVLPASEPMLVMRVNAGWQVVFDVWRQANTFVYRWYLRREQFEDVVGALARDLEKMGRRYWLRLTETDGVEFNWAPTTLKKAGGDQILLEVFSPNDALRLLDDDIMVNVCREFALGLMRQSRTPYGRYHCFDLADLLLELPTE